MRCSMVCLAALISVAPATALAAPAPPPVTAPLIVLGPSADATLPAVLPDSRSHTRLRAHVVALRARARAHSTRLGLRVRPHGAVPTSPTLLALEELRLGRVVAFLAARREVDRAVDERDPGGRHEAARKRGPAAYARAARLAGRLGIDSPADPGPGATAEQRAARSARWTMISRWLAGRREALRTDERPLHERIPHLAQLRCIASQEARPEHGGWRANTGNGYYGGLQMDIGFQRTYAPHLYRSKGTADNWTAEEQMLAAERAIVTRGFTPWPNTARTCGLL